MAEKRKEQIKIKKKKKNRVQVGGCPRLCHTPPPTSTASPGQPGQFKNKM